MPRPNRHYPGFVLEPLRRDQVRAVYPLLRHAGVNIDVKAWVRYARPLIDPVGASRRGAITIRRKESKLPCGLFCYAREQNLVHGDVLKAEHFIALDVIDSEKALAALLDGLESLSDRLGVRVVRAVVAPGEEGIAAVMRNAGLNTDAHIFSKSVQAGPKPAPNHATSS